MIIQLRIVKRYKEKKLKILLLREAWQEEEIGYVYYKTLTLRNKSWWKPIAPFTQHILKQLRCIKTRDQNFGGKEWYSQVCTKMFDMPVGQSWTQETPRIINVIADSWVKMESCYHGFVTGLPQGYDAIWVIVDRPQSLRIFYPSEWITRWTNWHKSLYEK